MADTQVNNLRYGFSVDAAQIIRYDAVTMIRNHSLSVLALTSPLTVRA